MTEITNNLISSPNSPPKINTLAVPDDSMNLDAHYSKNMKVKRPKVDNQKTPVIPNQKLYTYKDTDKRYQKLSEDVFTSYQKEKTNHEFSLKTYFKIFCAIVLTAGLFACLHYFKRK